MDDIFSNDDEQQEKKFQRFQVTPNYDDDFSGRRPKGRPVDSSGQNSSYPGRRNYGEVYADQNRTPTGRPVTQRFVPPAPVQRDIPPTRPVQSGYRQPEQYNQYDPPIRPNGNGYNPVKPVQPPVRDERSARPPKPPRKKKKIGAKAFLVALVAVILAAILGLSSFASSMLGAMKYETLKKNEYISSKELASSKKIKNILIIGSDARDDVKGMRSDTMILASIDTVNKKIKLTSFLRDSLVTLPQKGTKNKLNASCSFYGAQGVVDTIEYNFKVDIDDYVIVDFNGFTHFIDALGGVTVSDITKREVDWLKKNVKGIGIKEGTSHLTGGAALWYCRVRYTDSDFKRTERQRRVIGAVISQITKNPIKALKAAKETMSYFSTSMSKNKLANLGVSAIMKYLKYDIKQAQVPFEKTWWDARYSGIGSCLEMRLNDNVKKLHDFIYG